MNLLSSTENKIIKDKNVENIPHLEVTGIVNNDLVINRLANY